MFLNEKSLKENKIFLRDYSVVVAGKKAGLGLKFASVKAAMANPLKTKTITLSCIKFTQGVTVKPRSGTLFKEYF